MAFVPFIGDKRAKLLLEHLGSPEAIFSEKPSRLQKIPGIGQFLAQAVQDDQALKRAEREMAWMEKHKIRHLWFEDEGYPTRLYHCPDGPVNLFWKGSHLPVGKRVAAMVGTRDASPFGMEWARKLASDLAEAGVEVVSGLAMGIDGAAHRGALEFGPTWGVLAHGLDRIYPSQNRSLAVKMIENGGLITEFPSETNPDRTQFPRRNRIIAGLADATVVVEAKETGGALITAELAASYDREVFAIPGRPMDPTAAGTIGLIRKNIAHLACTAEDILQEMNWIMGNSGPQMRIFPDLSPEEQVVVDVLQEQGPMEIDALSYHLDQPTYKVLVQLLQLEVKGVTLTLPGQVYKLR